MAEASVIIYRPVTHLWKHIATAENLPTMLAGVCSVTTDDPKGLLNIGTHPQGSCTFMGFRATWTATMAEFDAPKLMSATANFEAQPDLKFRATVDVVLEPVAEGTLLSVNVCVLAGAQNLFGEVSNEVAAIAYSRSLHANLMNLADWLDSGKRRNLTSRHREVLRMIQKGLTDREIAEKLYISPKTVGHHVSAILAAFRVTQRQDLRRSIDLPDK
ncbi:MAG: LuxR C-terminal-related transcriptional regulator [Nocardiaceae bacterium]|nr:LuxR C-terminal-related transcriptional regulator [Nocardiaceae bacterium]